MFLTCRSDECTTCTGVHTSGSSGMARSGRRASTVSSSGDAAAATAAAEAAADGLKSVSSSLSQSVIVLIQSAVLFQI